MTHNGLAALETPSMATWTNFNGCSRQKSDMKIAYVSAYDSLGQRFNGMVLHRWLNRSGHESDYVVKERSLDEERVHELGGPRLRRINDTAVGIERKIGLQSTLPILGYTLRRQTYFRQADLVHLQLIHARSFLSLLQLPAIANGDRPVVWTLHDPWISNGHCVHSLGCERWKTGCGACPDLTIPLPVNRDATAFNWRLKRKILARTNVHLVVASDWMRRRVSESPILAHLPNTVIPFGLDRSIFQPLNKAECRRKLGIPLEGRVLAVRWTPWSIFKGTQYAEKALAALKPGTITHVLCFESRGVAEPDESIKSKYDVIQLEFLEDQNDVAAGLNAADVFLMPSIAETFGMMGVEAMACGIPTIVFEGTSLPEIVAAPKAGLAVSHEDASALAHAIETLIENDSMRRSIVDAGLDRVAREYTEERYIQRHIELYEDLIAAKTK